MKDYFVHLPAELIITILSHLDPYSIETCRSISKTFANLLHTHADSVYHQIAVRHGYAYGRTSSDSGLKAPENEPDGVDDLQKVITRQRVLAGFEDCTTWKQYVRTKSYIDDSWAAVRTSPFLITPSDNVWRFKIDSYSKLLVHSVPNGRICVLDLESDPTEKETLQIDPLPGSFYPHVELSEGYLIFTASGNQFYCYRRSDISDPSPETPGNPKNYFCPDIHVHSRDIPPNKRFEFHCVFEFASRRGSFTCLKARYPYLAVGHSGAHTIWIFDMEKKQLAETINACPNGAHNDYYYIELDSRYIFLSTDLGLRVYSLENGQFLAECHTSINFPEVEEFMGWSAVHHDSKGGHLLAVSRSGILLWTPNYSEFTNERGRSDRVAYLYVGSDMMNLAVEGNRAVVEVHYGDMDEVLYVLLELTEWDTISNFKRPNIRVLSGHYSPMPTSRLEMDAAGIYFTVGSGHETTADTMCLQTFSEDYPWKWLSIDGSTLSPACVEVPPRAMHVKQPIETPQGFGEGYPSVRGYSFTPE